MRKDVALLLGLLVASNGAWAWFAFRQPRADSGDEAPPSEEARKQRALARALADAETERSARPTLKQRPVELSPGERAAAPAPAGQAATVPARTDAPPRREDAERVRQHEQEVDSRARAWQRDALQVADGAKRADALRAIEDALLSKDPVLAGAGLRSVPPLRSLGQELARLRPLVVTRLGDEDPRLRGNAASALTNLPREAGDLELLLARLDGATTELQALLLSALNVNGSRAEGPLGDAFVRFLGGPDERRAKEVANLLRGRWVSPEVEDAVLAAWKRRTEESLWGHILGQVRPTREARLRALLTWAVDPTLGKYVELLEPALTKFVDEPVRPLAARLALEALPGGMDPIARSVLLQTIRANGTAEHAPALLAFAENPLVGEAQRALAKTIAEELAKKKP